MLTHLSNQRGNQPKKLPDSLRFSQDHVLAYKDGTEVPYDFNLVSLMFSYSKIKLNNQQ